MKMRQIGIGNSRSIFIFCLFVLGVKAGLAADASTCDVYAKAAVATNDRALRMGCTVANSSARWQSDYNNHYNWCLSANSTALVAEASGRDNDIRPCELLSTKCETYAEQAVRQFNRSKQLNCGFSASTQPLGRWMDNHRKHYDWCMTARPEWLGSEAQARSDALSRCLTQ